MTRGACFECGAEALHDHHVVPRSRGGTRTVPLCESCHGKAHHRDGAMRTSTLTRQALQARKASGLRAGNVPYGYRIGDDGKSLQRDEREQALLQRARDWRRAGLSMREIAAALNREGWISRAGRPFALVQVQRMLEATRANPRAVQEGLAL